MKKLHWVWAAGLVLLMASGDLIAAESGFTGTAKVVSVHGKARLSTDNRTWQALKKNMTLQPGAVIQTAEDSSLELHIGGPAEGTVRLQPNTVLGIERLGQPGGPVDVELDLRAGEIAGQVGELPNGSHYEVKFARGIAGVRGGTFHVSFAGQVAVSSGETVVVTVDPQGNPATKVVSAGKRFDSATGSVTEFSGNPDKLGAPANPETPATPAQKRPGLGGSLRNF